MDSTKITPGHVTPNLWFGIWWHMWVTQCIAVRPRREKSTIFFMLRWDRYELHKRHVGPHYAKHVFLHPVGSAGHVVDSGAYGTRNVDKLVIMLSCDRYAFNKKGVSTSYPELVFLHTVGFVGHVVYSCVFGARNVDALFFLLGWD
jgi:hypothetical protein